MRVLESPRCSVQGFLAAGHVCTVTGLEQYRPLAEKHHVPIVVTGFEPLDILQGVAWCVRQLEEGRAEVENQYTRSVRPAGNPEAMRLIHEAFQPATRKWRGIGEIQASGLELCPRYADFDAGLRFGVAEMTADEPAECIAGEILQGHKRPYDCPVFALRCTPDRPLGAHGFFRRVLCGILPLSQTCQAITTLVRRLESAHVRQLLGDAHLNLFAMDRNIGLRH